MAEATPATAVPNARLSGSKRKKVPGSSSHSWDSYLHKVLQDNHPGVKITKEAMQVWAEGLDAWLQQLAQEIVQEHTSQALTPANVRASLELLLAKGDTSKENSALTESVAHPNTSPWLLYMLLVDLHLWLSVQLTDSHFLPLLPCSMVFSRYPPVGVLSFCAVTHVCCQVLPSCYC